IDGGVLLVLGRPTADPHMATYSLLDTATLEETPSPLATFPGQLSPDGRWLVTTDYAAQTITFIDWRTGEQDVFRPRPWPNGSLYNPWRPGHGEFWLPNNQNGPPTTWIKKPGGAAVEVSGLAITLGNLQTDGTESIFTPDAAYWFSLKGATYDQGVMLGSADDPTGPRVQVTPTGTQAGTYWQTSDGLIVVTAWTSTPEMNDVYVVDPNTGGRQVMGEQGAVLAVGRTRLLVNQRLVHQAGDLTVFDLGTGHPTILAAEFALAAVVEAQGADQVAPGAAVAFKFQARFPSPYDGVWLATVP
ncbi:MAG TPA: hypothetical protein VLT58_10535, partial [Polyangia bacterium]|nr:hypothetical protein [Polyangia bacterium]